MTMRAFRDSDFRRFLLWAALAVLAAGGPACGQRKAAGPAGAPASAGDPERVVLQVAGSSYRAADFSRYATAAVGGNWQKLGPAALSQFFDQFVDDRLLYQAALNE